MNIGEAATRKIGPLPAWGWGVAVGGAFLVYRFVRGGSSQPQVVAVTGSQPGGSMDNAQAGTPLGVDQLTALEGQIAGQQGQLNTITQALSGILDKINGTAATTPPGTTPTGTPTGAPTVDFAGTKTPFGTVYPDYVHTYADAVAWIARALANGSKPISSTNIGPTPVTTAPASTPTSTTKAPMAGDFAGTKTPFGTVYPSYVHTYADAVAWISRALANGAKPKTSTKISTTPVR